MGNRTYKRRKKLIKPRLQLKVALAGLGISFVAVLLVVIMVNEALMQFASEGWVDAEALQAEWMGILLSKLVIALALLVPFTLALGVILTHRLAGPIYRFEMFLHAVMAGEHPEPCRLRKGDELWDFCHLLNEVTEPLRNGSVPLPHTSEIDAPAIAAEEAEAEVETAAA
jgi:hypothetical protein